MAEISWIKLTINMFDDEKIKLIQAMPDSDSIIIIWIRLLTLAGKTNDDGRIYIDEDLPYTDEILSTLFNKPLNTIRLAIDTLRKFKMIETNEAGHIEVINWEKHQNIDGMERIRKLNAEKQKRYRERKKLKQLRLEQGEGVADDDALRNANVTHDGTSPNRIREDIDIDIDKEINNKEGRKPAPRIYESSSEYYQLSEFLFEKMLENNPEAKKPDFNAWADHIRKMVEIDNRSVDKVRNMILWSQEDSFWKGNILSTRKLREKYDQMRVQALEDSKDKKSKFFYGGTPKVEKKPDWMDEPQPTEEEMISPEKQAEFEERLSKFRAGKKEEGA